MFNWRKEKRGKKEENGGKKSPTTTFDGGFYCRSSFHDGNLLINKKRKELQEIAKNQT